MEKIVNIALQKTDEIEFSEKMRTIRQAVDPEILNLSHLSQYTSGDMALELELLGLFKDQAILQFKNIEMADNPKNWEMAVHTLKGSARSVGAIQVDKLTASLETLGYDGPGIERQDMTSRVKLAVAICCVTIQALLNEA